MLFRSYFNTNFELIHVNIQINKLSAGFEYLHEYAINCESNEICIPEDKYEITLEQCEFFKYDKLKNLLVKKYICDHNKLVGTFVELIYEYFNNTFVELNEAYFNFPF